MRVTALRLYPVKSLAGVAPESARLDARGLRGDRRWGIVDPSGAKVTAREVKPLLGLTATPSGADGLSITLSDRDGGRLEVEPPRGAAPIEVNHSNQGRALPAGTVVDDWLSSRLGQPLRLVWQADDYVRFLSGGGPTKRRLDTLEPETRRRCLERVRERVAELEPEDLAERSEIVFATGRRRR